MEVIYSYSYFVDRKDIWDLHKETFFHECKTIGYIYICELISCSYVEQAVWYHEWVLKAVA